MGALAALLADLGTLLRPRPVRYLLLAVVAQVLFWYLGSPGPHLAGAPRTLATALATVGWAVVLLLAVPLGVMLVRRELPHSLGLAWGDWRVGAPATALMAAVAIAAMWIAARAPELQATYPLPGPWPGLSPGHLAAWTGFYLAYYVAFEFFYRGFMLRALEPLWGIAAAVWLQALASSLIHLGKPLPETLAALPFGLLLAVLAIRTRSLVWPILLHLAVGIATDVSSLQRQGWLWQ
jgi:uncharacterized protein